MTIPNPLSRVPEPALVRSILVAATGVVAYFVGHAVDQSWINGVVDTYALLSPVVAGILIRPAVTPVKSAPPGGGQ